MAIRIIQISDLRYESLSNILQDVNKNINDINILLKKTSDKKASELTQEELLLFQKRMFLSAIRNEINKKLTSLADQVKLPEDILR